MKSTYRPSKPKQTAQDFIINRIQTLRTKRPDERNMKRHMRKWVKQMVERMRDEQTN